MDNRVKCPARSMRRQNIFRSKSSAKGGLSFICHCQSQWRDEVTRWGDAVSTPRTFKFFKFFRRLFLVIFSNAFQRRYITEYVCCISSRILRTQLPSPTCLLSRWEYATEYHHQTIGSGSKWCCVLINIIQKCSFSQELVLQIKRKTLNSINTGIIVFKWSIGWVALHSKFGWAWTRYHNFT